MPFYVKLCLTLLNDAGDERIMSRWFDFSSQEQWEIEEDSMYDNVMQCINSTLPEGWALDEFPETETTCETCPDECYLITRDTK